MRKQTDRAGRDSEIARLIQQGESATVEFKESFDRTAVETAGAFANAQGGVILIGVSDRGKVKGVQISKTALNDWTNQIASATDPRLIPELDVLKVQDSTVVAVHICESPIKPVSVRGRCYRRVGTSNRTMTAREIAELHEISTGTTWDLTPHPDATLAEIDAQKVRRYVELANATGRRNISPRESSERVLRKLALLKNHRPTWAAVLLFGREDREYLSTASIHCGRFRGPILVIDDSMLSGSLIDQVDRTMDFIRKNIKVEFVMTGKPARENVWEYPLDALREAVVNAVCHRDYTRSSNTEVRIYDDELNVWNPGGLPLGITLEQLLVPHDSVLRNKGLAQVFYDIGWIERWGSGIDKIRRACSVAGLPEPAFEEHQSGFRVRFRTDPYTDEYMHRLGLNERQVVAVKCLREQKSLSLSAFHKLVPGVSEKTLYRDLRKMVSKGVLRTVGEKKGRSYELR